MKNLYIFDEAANSSQNGIGTYIAELRSHLRDVVRVNVLSFNDKVGLFRKENADGVTYYRFPVFCGGAVLNNVDTAMAIMRMEIPDAEGNVFLLNYFLCNGLLKALKEFFPLSKTVFVVHDQTWTERLLGDVRKFRTIVKGAGRGRLQHDEHDLLRHLFMKEAEMYRLADRCVVMNADTLTLLRNVYGVAPGKTVLIPNGRDLKCGRTSRRQRDGIRKRLLLAPQDKVLLYVGRTTECKGFHAALAAFEKIVRKHPCAKLVVLGRVHDLDVVTRLCPRGKARIVLAGQVAAEELAQWYRAADVGLVPSYSEQCGYAGMEMLASGLAVVASDGIGVRRMFRNGYNAVVAKIGNRKTNRAFVNSLVRAVETVLEMDDGAKRTLQDNARRTYLERYTMAAVKSAFVKLIDQLAGNGAEQPALPLPALPHKDLVYDLVLKCNGISSPGLLDGRMGIVSTLSQYAVKYGVEPLRNFCAEATNRCISALPSRTDASFSAGLSGIGWALEFLSAANIAEMDTLEVCRELDQRLMLSNPARMADLSLETGLEGVVAYVNAHLCNNMGRQVFAPSYLEEVKKALGNLPENAPDGLNEQAAIFGKLMRGESCRPDMSLLRFVGPSQPRKAGLQHGLAGQLVCSMYGVERPGPSPSPALVCQAKD